MTAKWIEYKCSVDSKKIEDHNNRFDEFKNGKLWEDEWWKGKLLNAFWRALWGFIRENDTSKVHSPENIQRNKEIETSRRTFIALASSIINKPFEGTKDREKQIHDRMEELQKAFEVFQKENQIVPNPTDIQSQTRESWVESKKQDFYDALQKGLQQYEQDMVAAWQKTAQRTEERSRPPGLGWPGWRETMNNCLSQLSWAWVP